MLGRKHPESLPGIALKHRKSRISSIPRKIHQCAVIALLDTALPVGDRSIPSPMIPQLLRNAIDMRAEGYDVRVF